MLAHPTIIVLELVRRVLVYEDVDKDLAARLEPGGHFGEQVGVPLHVLEHFDRKHMCEPEQRAGDLIGSARLFLRMLTVQTYCSFSSKSNCVKSPVITWRHRHAWLVTGDDINVVAFVIHLDVTKALFLAGPVDVNLLGPRVGQHLDAGFRVLFGQVESQTAPSATEVKDAEALSLSRTLLSQTGLLAVALEHDLFGLCERLFCVLDVLGSARSSRIFE